MKKFLILLTAALMLFALAACGSSSEEVNLDDQVITRSENADAEAEAAPAEETDTEAAEPAAEAEAETAEPETEEAETPAVQLGDVFAFDADGVSLVPGTPFDADALPEANNLYTVPSCAVEGTDNVYSYDTFEVTAYDDGAGEVIYSVYLTDPNATTTEGVGFGDSLDTVTAVYGSDYSDEDGSVVYTLGDTELVFILQDSSVISIEYLLIL